MVCHFPPAFGKCASEFRPTRPSDTTTKEVQEESKEGKGPAAEEKAAACLTKACCQAIRRPRPRRNRGRARKAAADSASKKQLQRTTACVPPRRAARRAVRNLKTSRSRWQAPAQCTPPRPTSPQLRLVPAQLPASAAPARPPASSSNLTATKKDGEEVKLAAHGFQSGDCRPLQAQWQGLGQYRGAGVYHKSGRW